MKKEELEKINSNIMIVKKKNIRKMFLFNFNEVKIIEKILYCIISDDFDEKYDLVLFSLANELAIIGSFMYESKGEVRKCSENYYKEEIFIGYAETKEEIFRFIKDTNGKDEDEIVQTFFNIRDIISRMLACETQFGDKYDYAYAVLYAKKHNGILPSPVGDSTPENYEDYDSKKLFDYKQEGIKLWKK